MFLSKKGASTLFFFPAVLGTWLMLKGFALLIWTDNQIILVTCFIQFDCEKSVMLKISMTYLLSDVGYNPSWTHKINLIGKL